MGKSKPYLTTGEFAKLCHTTKHTLFHYCDIDLFTPAYTDENGYRYYHVLQYDTFLTITQLRTAGMSLADIKAYMAERSPEHMLELFDQQEKSLNRQIAQLKQLKDRISTQKRNITQVLTCSEDYFLEKQNKACILCSDRVTQSDDYTMTSAIGDLIHSAHGSTAANALGMVCNLNDAVGSENYPFRFYVYSSKQAKCLIKPAGTYLSTYHRGEYETLQQSYKNLVSYANEQQMALENQIYAETIIGDWAVRNPQDYVIKVSAKLQEN